MMNEDIIRRLDDLERRVTKLEKLFESEPEKPKKKTSIREFLLEKKPKNQIQKTLVIGYYLEHYENMSSYNVRDLERGFRDARESIPSNMNQMVNENIKKNYMMQAKEDKDGLKAWYLTNSGERFVEDELKAE